MKTFTLVGSKDTVEPILQAGVNVAKALLSAGWDGYSGNAPGMDKSLEVAMHELKAFNGMIFLPWATFESRTMPERMYDVMTKRDEIGLKCHSMLETLIPWHEKLSRGSKLLHARNVKQVLGRYLKTPTSVVVHSARGNRPNRPSGGTRTAVVLANSHDIPTFNIRFNSERLRAISFFDDLEIDLRPAFAALGNTDFPDGAK